MTVYEKLRKMRTDKHFSEKDVAEILGMRLDSYSRLEHGVGKIGSFVKNKLALLYDKDPDYFVDDPETEPEPEFDPETELEPDYLEHYWLSDLTKDGYVESRAVSSAVIEECSIHCGVQVFFKYTDMIYFDRVYEEDGLKIENMEYSIEH